MPRPRKALWDQPLGDRPDQHVGALLHGLREHARVTQAEVALAIGVDASLISRVERGSRPASERILRYYGERFGAVDLLAALAEIARQAEQQRASLRDPELIARQAEYPLPGDEARYVSESAPDGITAYREHDSRRRGRSATAAGSRGRTAAYDASGQSPVHGH